MSEAAISAGAIRLRGVSRRFKILHDRSLTLKETLIRRKRTEYTELWALRDVDLDIAPGESVGIVGRNGSGKSTLLKLLAGIIPPQSGTVETSGSVASMLELGSGFHPDFTGRENVFMNGAIHGLTERQVRDRLDAIIDFAEVADFIDMPVRTYSSGMQMRLAFAVASHVDPDILLLDEVLAVGDEAFQRKCMGRIFEFRRRGGTLVFVSHDPGAVEQVCDRAVLINDGIVLGDGPPTGVLESYHRLLAAESRRPRAAGASTEVRHEDPAAEQDPSDARITSVGLVADGKPVENLASGDEAVIRIEGRAERRIEQPTIGISITSVDGTLCFGTNTRLAGVDVAMLEGAFRIEITLPRLALNEGRFDLSADIRSQDDATVFDQAEHVTPFTVFATRPGSGLVSMDSEWSVRLVSGG